MRTRGTKQRDKKLNNSPQNHSERTNLNRNFEITFTHWRYVYLICFLAKNAFQTRNFVFRVMQSSKCHRISLFWTRFCTFFSKRMILNIFSHISCNYCGWLFLDLKNNLLQGYKLKNITVLLN